ncbi:MULTISPECIES: hypothetical protein [unclassified Nonomuraea]|uniref:hypothetical protein n=1 Tax=unclassified Nonomuraea TaxID=2593643 RepID=UPI0033C67A37
MKRVWYAAIWLGMAVLAAQVLTVQPTAAATIPAGSIEVKTVLSPFSLVNKSQRVNCSPGKVPLGGGAQTSGGQHLIITEARPISDAAGAGFVVTVQVDQIGVTAPWAVSTFVSCAVAPPGYEVITQVNPPTTRPSDSVLANCSPGKNVIGSGGQLIGAHGQLDLTMGPNHLNGVASGVGAEAAKDDFSVAPTDPYQVASYAICARENRLFDFLVVENQTSNDAAAQKKVTTTCPSGYQATGGAISSVGFGAHLLFFRPNVTSSPVSFDFAASAPPGFGVWNLAGIVHCTR